MLALQGIKTCRDRLERHTCVYSSKSRGQSVTVLACCLRCTYDSQVYQDTPVSTQARHHESGTFAQSVALRCLKDCAHALHVTAFGSCGTPTSLAFFFAFQQTQAEAYVSGTHANTRA